MEWGKVMRKKRHKDIMMTGFIKSAEELIDELGIEKVTLRKIASKAGYNSATIYNYFENLDHLIFYAAMRHIKDYSLALGDYLKDAENAMDIFLKVWECFCNFAYEKPEIYNAIFFPNLNNNLDYYMEEYYTFFPIDLKDLNINVSTMILRGDIKKRAKSTIMGCVEEGYIAKEDAEKLNDITLLIFEAFLKRILKNQVTYDEARNLTMDYIKSIVERFLIKDYKFFY